eukprot:gb/GECG01014728.1/.p1 GENE.gb/GECG01014728.1/~~gb/GECG01014728.1/.p1  ORF type:complete len:267 (+),score=20.82 gb/GECG01014728.1/:1-801(+)
MGMLFLCSLRTVFDTIGPKMKVLSSLLGLAIWAQIVSVAAGLSVRGYGPSRTASGKAASFYPGQVVSTDTMNSMYDQDNINNHIISCLLPDNTADETCESNVKNSMSSNVGYIPDISLNPNARLGDPKSQADKAVSNVSHSNIGYISIDVIDASYWPGPVSANQKFLGTLMERLDNNVPNSALGIRTNKLAWHNIMGNWTEPADNGRLLWNVLLDGDSSFGSVSFGGWTSSPDYKQYLEKNTLQSVEVDLSNFRIDALKPTKSLKL